MRVYLFFLSTKYFLSFLFKKNFTHCAGVIDSGNNLVIFEPTNSQLIIKSINDAKGDTLSSIIKEWKPTVAVVGDINYVNRKTPLFRPASLSCVGALKYLIGDNSFKHLTPYSLYKALKSGNIKTFNLKEVVYEKTR